MSQTIMNNMNNIANNELEFIGRQAGIQLLQLVGFLAPFLFANQCMY